MHYVFTYQDFIDFFFLSWVHTKVRLLLRVRIHLGWNVSLLAGKGTVIIVLHMRSCFFLWERWGILRWVVVSVRTGTLLNNLSQDMGHGKPEPIVRA